MKEFMRRDTRQVFIRIDANGGRVRVLHATATSSLANVKNKCVMLERCSIHELQFVVTDAPKILLDAFLAPIIAVNYHPHLRHDAAQLKLLELPYLDGPIRERIVARGFEDVLPSTAHRFDS